MQTEIFEDAEMTASQRQMILAHMKAGKTITPLEALQKFGCMRLSARIWELRKQNHDIKTTKRGKVNRFGRVARFAEYSLENAA